MMSTEITLIGPDFKQKVGPIGTYPDGTSYLKVPEFQFAADHARTMVVRTTSVNDLMVAMDLSDSLFEHDTQGLGIEKLVIPFIPGGRQDRVNPEGDVIFTLKRSMSLIFEQSFTHVVTVDPHSAMTKDVFTLLGAPPRILSQFPLKKIAAKIPLRYDAVIAPDKGARSRAGIFAKVLGIPLVTATKERDVATGRLSNFQVNVKAGKKYLIVDDICDGGGTFFGLGREVLSQGAEVDLYVTHGLFTKGTRELKKIFKNIYTTDSIARDRWPDLYTIQILGEMI